MRRQISKRRIQLGCLIVAALAALAGWPAGQLSNAHPADGDGMRTVFDRREKIAPQTAKTYRLPSLDPVRRYSLGVSLASPAALQGRDTVTVSLRDGGRVVADKTLHAGDPDLYTLFRPASSSTCQIEVVCVAAGPVEVAVTLIEWPGDPAARATAEAEPNDSWREANEIKLGQTVWATADDKPYIVAPGERPAAAARIPYQQTPVAEASGDTLPGGGADWFKFTYDGDRPLLIHFELDLPERDNIPVDVSVYTVENGAAKVYEEGADPVSPPHEVQALPGNKFTTRTITRGTYYVRVEANHPLYRLRTAAYDLPPYADARQAVRAGMDYIVSAGDSWHANTPRHGGIVNRVSSNHAETRLCIACHATHFTTRAELTAKQNGYEVLKRSSLEFLTERLANNPRPFYGHKDAYWTRVISASANVMSRLAVLVNQYDAEFKLARKTSLLKGVGEYLKLYYKGRTVLPSDETNGNTPLVSTYEVAWYSWQVFDELFRQTNDAQARQYRDLVRSLIEQEAHKNLVDLCWQTIAFVNIDRAAYAEKIKRNAERILSLQRADGQWSMLFEPQRTPVEFQTYHCLYTLALAGHRPDHPQIAKSLQFTLQRQQPFGGWFDPRQTYENFRTPFRETQFAVMALSEFYKGAAERDRSAHAQAPLERLSAHDVLLSLEELDGVWERPGAGLTRDLTASLSSGEPLVRAAADNAGQAPKTRLTARCWSGSTVRG